MSNVIALLETLGADASLANMDAGEFAAAVAGLPLDDDARAALLARDADALNGLLGGRMQMMCLLFPADGQEPAEEQPAQDDEPSEQEPDQIHDASRH